MLTQLATQMEVATQTVQYGSDGSTLLTGLITLFGVSVGMIVAAALYERFTPVVQWALEIRRLHRAQAHAA
jgi:hypothetical protein